MESAPTTPPINPDTSIAPGPIPPCPRGTLPAHAEEFERVRDELATWRDRATKAEELATTATARAGELEASLSHARARAAVDIAERSRRIDQVLMDEGVIDLETARLVTESTLARSPTTDVSKAIRDLRRRKPFLFRGTGSPGGILAPARPANEPQPHDSIEDLSARARTTGDRTALLRYLRLKRGL